MRAVAFTLFLAFAGVTAAEGPGSRIGTTPEVPPVSPAPERSQANDEKRCDAFNGERKEQCLRNARAERGRPTSGPESAGAGSGAGSSASSGTTGGASFGGSAPR